MMEIFIPYGHCVFSSKLGQLHGNHFWHWLQDHPDIYNDDVSLLKRASGYEKGSVKLMQLTQTLNRIYIVFNRI